MNGILPKTWDMTALALLSTACGSGDNRTDQMDRDSVSAHGAQTARVDRKQIRSAMREIASDLGDRIADLTRDVREHMPAMRRGTLVQGR